MNKRLYSLDLLRFILASLVVVVHFLDVYGYSVAQNSYNSIPMFGLPLYHVTFSRAVDVFFVLSGFTMAYSTMRKQSSITFLKKRAARIFPLYILASVVAAPLFLLIPASSPQHKVFTLDYIINLLILRPTNQLFLISVAWTLSFEWIFYVVFASVMSISHKFRVHIVSVIFILAMTVSFLFPYSGQGYASIILDGRFLLLEFIAGMWIAYYYDSFKIPHAWILCVIGGVLMYCTIFTPLFDCKYRGIVFVIPAALIVIGALNIDVKEKKQKLFKKMGDISYTMYIMHTFTTFSFAYLLYNILHIQTHAWFWLVVSLVITIPTALFTNYFIEKPLYKFFSAIDFRGKNKK